MSRQEDSELLERFKKGNEEAFNQIYRKHFFRLVALLEKQFRHKSECLDIAQETFITLFYKKDNIKNTLSLKHWIDKVAFNHMFIHLRKNDVKLLEYEGLNLKVFLMKKFNEMKTPESEFSSKETINSILSFMKNNLNKNDIYSLEIILSDDKIIDQAKKEGIHEKCVRSKIYRLRRKIYVFILRNFPSMIKMKNKTASNENINYIKYNRKFIL